MLCDIEFRKIKPRWFKIMESTCNGVLFNYLVFYVNLRKVPNDIFIYFLVPFPKKFKVVVTCTRFAKKKSPSWKHHHCRWKVAKCRKYLSFNIRYGEGARFFAVSYEQRRQIVVFQNRQGALRTHSKPNHCGILSMDFFATALYFQKTWRTIALMVTFFLWIFFIVWMFV